MISVIEKNPVLEYWDFYKDFFDFFQFNSV
jgi:hypothetical protein